MTERTTRREGWDEEAKGRRVGGGQRDCSSPPALRGSDTCAWTDEMIHLKVRCVRRSAQPLAVPVFDPCVSLLQLNVPKWAISSQHVLLIYTIIFHNSPPLLSLFPTSTAVAHSISLFPPVAFPLSTHTSLHFTDDRLADCNPTDAGAGRPDQLF